MASLAFFRGIFRWVKIYCDPNFYCYGNFSTVLGQNLGGQVFQGWQNGWRGHHPVEKARPHTSECGSHKAINTYFCSRR